ncbi:Phosphotransferase [Talaromyces marneffei ATCC 18224]|uniref:diacylglycerol cholinephosphotransferase n=1 Tax=Talaromyces marneffei (strain ATCC 18224 / CBS 334.59 / QM 7333) TaxID=441960 RepID=B6QTC7_TALMQ|nr:uncharacterized protein EYB26_008919 [Talaromyces marneffei]EEA19544.1 aminoalcoholphosphotransferase [Talaromyces marneffei ATCC 18224]KAE8547858.1 hypothetical protein EYB25_009651 [Talaromyces marneffei]QGA21209.1 hypothetical protein EYB26_008919 [Talaromyces marneffei]
MTWIRQYDLPALREYKYSGVDHSLISRYIMKPFYSNVVIHLFPLNMAPNLITLTGFSFVVINFLTMLYFNPTLDKDCPSWVYLSWAIGLFLYQTFDAVDGMQARRTRQSGPLGELFDHGVDACNTVLGVFIFAATMNLGQSWATVLTLWGAVMTFYVQTWDEYFTHVLTLGIISGPVEGILTLCAVFSFTAYMGGGSFWHRPMLATIGVSQPSFLPDALYELPFTSWYMIYGAFMLFFATGSSIINVMKARRARRENPITPLFGLLPFTYMWILTPAYLYLQPSIRENHLVPFLIYVGIVNAYSVGQMIVAHLLKTSFPRSNVLILPLVVGVVDSLGPYLELWPSLLGDDIYQVAFVFATLGLAVGVYASFVHTIIVTMCDYLDIWCLTIKHPYVEGQEKINGHANGDSKKSS